MKKLLLLAVVAFSSSVAFSQMVVSGGDFANHPERYENKPVSINQVTVGGSQEGHGHAGLFFLLKSRYHDLFYTITVF